MNTILAKAVAFDEASRPEFKTYAATIIANASALARELQNRGMLLVTGGTDNHLLLIDVQHSLGMDGAKAEAALDVVGLNANKNVIPDDPQPPFSPSGLRLGTPAITTRGLRPEHMPQLAEWIVSALKSADDQLTLAKLRAEVADFARHYPLP